MRLWSLHPAVLDRPGLTGGWREALLAQAVLLGRTQGYRSHPQLIRFREQPDPVAAIGVYLEGIAEEATARGYRFDRSRIAQPGRRVAPIPVTRGQVYHEWDHLRAKLARRSPERARAAEEVEIPALHPLFTLVPGPVASWERTE